MQYNISFDVCAILILIILVVVHIRQKTTPVLQNRLFLTLLFMITMGVIAEVANSILEIRGGAKWLLGLTCTVLLFCQNFAVYLYACYARAMIKNDYKDATIAEKIVLTIPIFVSGMLILTSYYSEMIFYYDAAGVYNRGPLHPVLFVTYTLHYLVCVYYLNIYRKAMKNYVHLVPVFATAMAAFSWIIQYQQPTMLLFNLAQALSIMTFMLVVQKSDEELDPVMHVFNRKSFNKVFDLKKEAKQKYHVVLICVEDTKLLNQAIGLNNMNEIMRQIAKYIETFSPKGVFYLGSNTFALMLEGKGYREVADIMNRIDKRFCENWDVGETELYINVRMLKLFLPKEAPDIETLYSYMDYVIDLDNSKKWILNGTDVNLYDKKRKLQIENAVRNAIIEDRFEVYYQPIYSVEDRTIHSAEALIRLKDPELGNIPPMDFIPLAEHNGTILKIGLIVFEKVCQFIHDNDLVNKGIEYIEINLSVVQCMQENMGEALLAIMRKYGVESSRINLEITETAATSSPKMLVKNMRHLFENGISFSLDDFGTGYSNMKSLVDLPLDMVKFDKTMIDAISKTDRGKVLLISSIAMIRRLDLKIVAEGVETKEQAELLSEMGVNYLQGYYFERPVNGERFIEYLENFKVEDYL